MVLKMGTVKELVCAPVSNLIQLLLVLRNFILQQNVFYTPTFMCIINK